MDTQHPVDPRHAWLGVVLPVRARRFRVDDPMLAWLLAEAGAEVVASEPEVEIAPAPKLRGDAEIAVVQFDRGLLGTGSRLRRGAGRLVRGAGLAIATRRAARRLRRAGYSRAVTIAWERSVPATGRGLPEAEARRFAHRFPLNAVVVGHRGEPPLTILGEAVAAADRATGASLRPLRVVFGSSGVVVADLGAAILRLTVGPATARIEAHRKTVEQLLALEPPPLVRERVPRVMAHGRAGLAAWTLEEKLAGGHQARLDPAALLQAADFLAGLARLPAAGAARARFLAAAETIGRECARGVGEDVTRTAANAMDDLADVASCFSHGDFWAGNLLLEDGRLTGVIDWSAGGADGLPTIDALHLHVSATRQETGEPLGAAVATRLRAADPLGDSDFLRAYTARTGIGLGDGERRAIVVAYWLDALARELRDPDSPREPDTARWERNNVAPVLAALDAKPRAEESNHAVSTPT